MNSLAVIFIIIVLVSCGSARHSKGSKNLMPGTWQSTPIVIDGDSKDWPSPYPNYDATARVAYATSNDAQNLYISMESGDEMTLLKILKQGMTVSVDTSGKKDPQFNINYPLQNDNEPLDMPKHDHAQNVDSRTSLAARQTEQKINKLAQEANQFSLDGFANCNGGYLISQTVPCGIRIKARIDEYKELVWEVVIPFKAIYNRESISTADAGKPISVCFSINRFKPASPKNDNNGGSGSNSGMGGAGSNSSMGGGSGGRGGGRGGKGGGARNTATDPNQQLYESTKTWKHFAIVYQH